MQDLTLVAYALPLILIYAWYWWRRQRKQAVSQVALDESVAAGIKAPASLHPVIDNSHCIGCGACVSACPEMPEHQVLGVIDGKAQLVGPGECIGHGACREACPTHAITLVFGSAERGVDIPALSPDFETNVPGIYIAGELGGMGLIRNALQQGRQAVEAVKKAGRKIPGATDLIVVGAGPAGLAAALTAKSLGLSCTVLEQESMGGCVFHYPRKKLVMTRPMELPLIGSVDFKTVRKEELLDFWIRVAKEHELDIRTHQFVEKIEPAATGFKVQTRTDAFQSANVLLAVGRRGTPRKLDVPGEDLPKVVYRLVDAEQYSNTKVLVVGGGDSALEAAASIAEQPGTRVILSYRGAAFQRAKPKNRDRVAAAEKAGNLEILLNSNVRSIQPDSVELEQAGKMRTAANDFVIVNAGGVLPNDFLRSIGVLVETKYGTA